MGAFRLEDVGRFQFARGGSVAADDSVSELEQARRRFDRELVIDCDAAVRARTLRRIDGGARAERLGSALRRPGGARRGTRGRSRGCSMRWTRSWTRWSDRPRASGSRRRSSAIRARGSSSRVTRSSSPSSGYVRTAARSSAIRTCSRSRGRSRDEPST